MSDLRMIRRHPFRRCCAVRLCDDCVYEVVVVESFKIRCLEVEMSLVVCLFVWWDGEEKCA